MVGNKRRIETVDLTGDDENAVGISNKVSKPNITPSGSQGRHPLPTPPSSSQPHGSQSRSNSSLDYSQTYRRSDRDRWLASTQENDEDIRREINLEGE